MDNINIMCNDEKSYSMQVFLHIIAFCDMRVDIIRMLVGNDLT